MNNNNLFLDIGLACLDIFYFYILVKLDVYSLYSMVIFVAISWGPNYKV